VFGLCLALWWGLCRSRWAAVVLVVLATGGPVYGHSLRVGPSYFSVQKPKHTLRIMQWNCMGLPGIEAGSPMHPQAQAAIAALVRFAPDVICLQDFTNYTARQIPSSVALLTHQLGYRYHYFNAYYTQAQPWGTSHAGSAIFSRFPIVDSGQVAYPQQAFPEGICWATLQVGGNKLVRAVSTHFQSMHLKAAHESAALPNFYGQDSNLIAHGGPIAKLKHFQGYHLRQATLLRRFLDTCSLPFVLGADLNSVPASPVYASLQGCGQDAFLQAGSGLGGTYRTRLPGIRIDYLFASHGLRIRQFTTYNANFYDHHPLFVDIDLP
jgi:endonuclease/exonuclease/phosphatase family metal-dependent hydrolase